MDELTFKAIDVETANWSCASIGQIGVVLVATWTDAPRSCLIADRGWNVDVLRAWLVQQGIEAVMPAWTWRMNPQPHAQHGTRRATP